MDARYTASGGPQGAIESSRAGIAANAQQISENERATDERFASLADYDVKGNLVINYPNGVSTLTQKDKAALKDLAASATKNPHFLIQVQGYADSSGNLSMNQTLSKDRAEAVANYLLQECKVAPRHIVSPGAMGIAHPVASNEAETGRAQNGRVADTSVMPLHAASGSGGPCARFLLAVNY